MPSQGQFPAWKLTCADEVILVANLGRPKAALGRKADLSEAEVDKCVASVQK
jgi:hypothetical protein